MAISQQSTKGNYIKKTVTRQWRLSVSATMGSLNIFIRVPSYPSTNLHVLTPPSPTMVRPTCKRKAGDSKDTGPQNRSKRAVTCETSSGSNSSSRERLQYEDLVSQVLEIAKTAEITILKLMRKYSFSLATLKDLLRSVYYLSELRI